MDGVQVHAAHGYLLAQFLSLHVNRRDDGWGGDVAGRARALLESVRAARSATSVGFTVAVKPNASDFRHGGFTEDDAEEVVRMLVAEGVDLIEVSGGTYESPALFGIDVPDNEGAESAPAGAKEAYFAAFASRARAGAPDVPIMLTGGIRTRGAMEALLGSGAVDLVGLARPVAIDPDLPARLVAGGDGEALPSYRLRTVAGLRGSRSGTRPSSAASATGGSPTGGCTRCVRPRRSSGARWCAACPDSAAAVGCLPRRERSGARRAPGCLLLDGVGAGVVAEVVPVIW